MNIKRSIFINLTDIFFSSISCISNRNFNWVTEWYISDKCNLNCVYCIRPSVDENKKRYKEDYGKSARIIEKLKPKNIVLTGGEPLINKDLPAILQDFKMKFNPKILAVTNLCIPDKNLEELMPYIFNFQVSLDAIGETNRKLRGIDGDFVLGKIAYLHDNLRKYHENPSVFTNTVLTKENCKREQIEELLDALKNINENFLCCFNLVFPFDSSLSIVNDRKLLEETVCLLDELGKKYKINKLGLLDQIDEKESILMSTRCCRQYFVTRVRPDGSLENCKPCILKNEFLTAVSKRDFKRVKKAMSRIYLTLIKKPYSPVCFTPCNCFEYIDDFLFTESRETEAFKTLTYNISPLTAEEKEESYKFIKRYLNKDFKREFLDW